MSRLEDGIFLGNSAQLYIIHESRVGVLGTFDPTLYIDVHQYRMCVCVCFFVLCLNYRQS